MKYSLVIWDWNGTLLDDVGPALASVNDMLERRKREPITLRQYYDYIGTPIRRFYERLFDLNAVDYAELLKEYNRGYEKHLERGSLMKGALEALDRFRAEGASQIVVSSCEETQLNRLIGRFGVAGYFDAVLGSSDFYAGSKVERAAGYIAAHAVEPAKTLVIGDLLHDAETAKHIGADCVLLSAGHQSTEILKESGLPVVGSIGQILDIVL